MEEYSLREIFPNFVNRRDELREITRTVDALLDRQQLVRTPIIEYSGVQGIGKSTLLRCIEYLCTKKSIPCIYEEARHITQQHFHQASALAEREEPVVMIVDALDDFKSESEAFQEIERSLSELLESSKSRVFVVLASRSAQKFSRTRSIKRKLTIRNLKPLEQKDCRDYLSNFAQVVPPEAWDSIFEWTRGYPLALETMTRVIRDRQLDPTQPDGQRQLINILMQEVVVNTLLAHASSLEERIHLQRLLALLSIPRRFNITLAQDLIEKFAPQYKLGSSFAYITLPQTVNEVTNVLAYKLELVGYCIDTPVRNLFLIHSRITNPREYKQIHLFLAEQNQHFVQVVSKSDRVRYLREFFYHLAYSAEDAVIREKLTSYLGQLAQVQDDDARTLVQSFESSFLAFFLEYQDDEELKEALGLEHARFVYWLWYSNVLAICRQIPENMREGWLKQIFSLVTDRPERDDFPSMFQEGMRRIIGQVSRDKAIMLFEEFIQEKQVMALLGEQSDNVRIHVMDSLLEEGS